MKILHLFYSFSLLAENLTNKLFPNYETKIRKCLREQKNEKQYLYHIGTYLFYFKSKTSDTYAENSSFNSVGLVSRYT